MRIMTAAAVLCTASTCFAAIVPTGYSATPGTHSFLGPLANTGRTYQLLINANQLTSLVGQDLLGLSWRLPTSATAAWPSVDVTFSNYDIYLSGSVAPADRSLTFAENVVGMQTQVRSGSLSIPTGAFPFGDTPNSAGPMITFNAPYTYTGGHLLVERFATPATTPPRAATMRLEPTSPATGRISPPHGPGVTPVRPASRATSALCSLPPFQSRSRLRCWARPGWCCCGVAGRPGFRPDLGVPVRRTTTTRSPRTRTARLSGSP